MSTGPIYGVELIDSLPLGKGGMTQAMPSQKDLLQVQSRNVRVVAGYEVLLSHYRHQLEENERLRGLLRNVIAGDYTLTGLQEAIGDLNRKENP